jgi:hypothetical protein
MNPRLSFSPAMPPFPIYRFIQGLEAPVGMRAASSRLGPEPGRLGFASWDAFFMRSARCIGVSVRSSGRSFIAGI